MRDLSFDPRMVVMDSVPEDGCDYYPDYGFAFNDSNFSDRVLRIYILSESLEPTQSQSAARSPFFYQLFSNGMRESEQCHATLRIHASEEVAILELLKFMYTNTLTVTTVPDVLDVLMVADKFDVASCIRHCSRLLRNLPMTPECVLAYLHLPSTILMAEAFQTLTIAAKQFYAVHYKDITKFQDEILSLPLASVEAIISSDDLNVASEDEVYDFVLKWVQARYPKLGERRRIMRTHLANLIRFPYMSYETLTKVKYCIELEHDFSLKLVAEAISFKHKQDMYINDENSALNHRFVARTHYKYQTLKVVEFKQPHPRLVVYSDFKLDECATYGTVYSKEFNFNSHWLYLQARCNKDQHIFELFLGIREKEGVYFVFDYEFAAKSKSAQEFVSKFKGRYACTGANQVGCQCLFTIPWISFINSVYFIDNVLHLRLQLSYRR